MFRPDVAELSRSSSILYQLTPRIVLQSAAYLYISGWSCHQLGLTRKNSAAKLLFPFLCSKSKIKSLTRQKFHSCGFLSIARIS